MRAVAFDAMGVLYRNGDDLVELLIPFARANGSPLSGEEIGAVYRSASRGEMTSTELWRRLATAGDPVEMDRLHLAAYELTPGALELLDELRDRGISLACITNDLAEWSLALRTRYGLGERIPHWTVSGEVGARKPDERIYRAFLNATGFAPEDVVVVDDRARNIAAAAALGFATIQVDFAGTGTSPGTVRSVGELRAALTDATRPRRYVGSSGRRPNLGETFEDTEVAQLYAYRAPYPTRVFAVLRQLLVEPRTVLDAGAGTGALAREMARFAERVDAVDPSEAMVAEGRRLQVHADDRIRWIVDRAESAPLAPPYGLITCGASIHWMDLDVVLRRFREALAPGGVIAIVDTEILHGDYRDDALAVIREHSEVKEHVETRDVVERLRRAGGLDLIGEERTEPELFEQSVDDYLRAMHSTSTLARIRLRERADAFDADMRAVFARHGIVRPRCSVIGVMWWGR